jgi:hypothetical protein
MKLNRLRIAAAVALIAALHALAQTYPTKRSG